MNELWMTIIFFQIQDRITICHNKRERDKWKSLLHVLESVVL